MTALTVDFGRVALVGCGLIGGSFGLALRSAGRVGEIVGFDRDPVTAARAKSLGIVDRVSPTLADTVIDADLVIVATPVAQVGAIFATIAPCLAPGAIVTDVGSTKRDVIAAARAALGNAVVRFVPGHPIAGREIHGPDAASAELFRGKRVLLTPLRENDAALVERVAAAWTACGASVDRLDPDAHDAALSLVSHLPHLLAYLLVAQVADAPDAAATLSLAGGGFRDFTRIAASSPEMWRDVALANAEPLLRDLDDYRCRIDQLRTWIANADGDAMQALFTRASAVRTAWTAAG